MPVDTRWQPDVNIRAVASNQPAAPFNIRCGSSCMTQCQTSCTQVGCEGCDQTACESTCETAGCQTGCMEDACESTCQMGCYEVGCQDNCELHDESGCLNCCTEHAFQQD